MVVRSLPSTLRFNLAYFPLSQALRLPVIVSHRVWLDHLEGSVEVRGELRTGMIRIGVGEVGIFDRQRSRTMWRVDGKVVFEGKAKLGHGTHLAVDPGATVVFGADFVTSAETSISCSKAITFGSGVLVSWEVLIMDSDWHSVLDSSGARINPDTEIVVGDHVWIGCRSTILKGARLAPGSVVAAGSVVTHEFATPDCVIAGVPARETRAGVTWAVSVADEG